MTTTNEKLRNVAEVVYKLNGSLVYRGTVFDRPFFQSINRRTLRIKLVQVFVIISLKTGKHPSAAYTYRMADLILCAQAESWQKHTLIQVAVVVASGTFEEIGEEITCPDMNTDGHTVEVGGPGQTVSRRRACIRVLCVKLLKHPENTQNAKQKCFKFHWFGLIVVAILNIFSNCALAYRGSNHGRNVMCFVSLLDSFAKTSKTNRRCDESFTKSRSSESIIIIS